jgi:glyoxylase-like metal-dependent hydrolase (beta-lactamase superfamily II)
MRVHHLNCMTTRPAAGRSPRASNPGAQHHGGLLERGHFIAHCLLVETDEGLVLVDTGLGLGDVADPELRLSRFFLRLLKPELRAEMTAARQVERLGFRASDVRDIVLTQLGFDHAGGLDDFPRARVHLLARERDNAVLQKTWMDRQRFRPQQWSTRSRWITYAEKEGEHWMGLQCVRQLSGLPEDILLIPLAGHTLGHAGVAVRTDAGWYLHAGDAFFDPRELDAHPRCRMGLRLYQRMLDTDRSARLHNQARLRAVHRSCPEIEIFCSHDPEAFERLSGRTSRVPAEPRPVDAGDPYRKIVRRREMAMPAKIAHEAVPGIEVHDHEVENIDFDFDSLAPAARDETARPNP